MTKERRKDTDDAEEKPNDADRRQQSKGPSSIYTKKETQWVVKEEKEKTPLGNFDTLLNEDPNKEEDVKEEEQDPAKLVVSTTRTHVYEIRENQRKRSVRKRGLESALLDPKKIQQKALEDAQRLLEEHEEDDEIAGCGLMQTQFTKTSGGKNTETLDKHLEAYLAERLGEKKKPEEPPRSKAEISKARLYEIPPHLQVKDSRTEEADKMTWVTGLVEVALPIESKLRNIEATERAKRELLKLGRTDDNYVNPNSTEAIQSRAFGSRFMNTTNMNPTKTATDDVALERFRKRFKK